MFMRIDAVIRAKPEAVGIAALFFGFALFFLMPGKLASAISAAIFFTGFVYGAFAYSKADTKEKRRILVAVTAMCLVASVGIGYVTAS
jgi:hypothetical protein